jgi:hypothetical protein
MTGRSLRNSAWGWIASDAGHVVDRRLRKRSPTRADRPPAGGSFCGRVLFFPAGDIEGNTPIPEFAVDTPGCPASAACAPAGSAWTLAAGACAKSALTSKAEFERESAAFQGAARTATALAAACLAPWAAAWQGTTLPPRRPRSPGSPLPRQPFSERRQRECASARRPPRGRRRDARRGRPRCSFPGVKRIGLGVLCSVSVLLGAVLSPKILLGHLPAFIFGIIAVALLGCRRRGSCSR